MDNHSIKLSVSNDSAESLQRINERDRLAVLVQQLEPIQGCNSKVEADKA